MDSSKVLASRFSFFMKDRIVAQPGFNRWKIPPIAIAIHLCIGSLYSWSIFNPVLVKELGVVASAAEDWGIGEVVWVFSVAILFLGLSAAFTGRWIEEVGPRLAGVVAACLWGGGFVVGGVGIYLHQIWIVYLGYGVLGGCGLGLAYVSPVATLLRWFPDRRGMAAGMAIMGFGGGAIIAVPLKEFLLRIFNRPPEYLGPVGAVELAAEQGRRFAEVSGQVVEVVVVSAADASAISTLLTAGPDGVYVVGSGSTGAAATFITLGLIYFAVMFLASLAYRIPAPNWRPNRQTPSEDEAEADDHGDAVHVSQAPKTLQFYLLWIVLCFNVTAGIGIIGVAKTMMTEIFGGALPGIVTPAFAATYVLMISLFNLLGRFAWGFASDYLGRKNTYYCFTGLGALLYLSIPFAASAVGANPIVVWLVIFYAGTLLAFTMYGGGFAIIPAYIADMFGTLHVGGIHGKLLTAWSAAGVLGPFILTSLREFSVRREINELASKVNPADFEAKFGASISNLGELISANTVTISSLMEIAPAGTVDPTPSIYNLMMWVMAGLLVIAFFANMQVHPVDESHLVRNTHDYYEGG